MKKKKFFIANSFEEAEEYDLKYYKNMSSTQKLDTLQYLRDLYVEKNNININEIRKRLRRSVKVVQQK